MADFAVVPLSGGGMRVLHYSDLQSNYSGYSGKSNVSRPFGLGLPRPAPYVAPPFVPTYISTTPQIPPGTGFVHSGKMGTAPYNTPTPTPIFTGSNEYRQVVLNIAGSLYTPTLTLTNPNRLLGTCDARVSLKQIYPTAGDMFSGGYSDNLTVYYSNGDGHPGAGWYWLGNYPSDMNTGPYPDQATAEAAYAPALASRRTYDYINIVGNLEVLGFYEADARSLSTNNAFPKDFKIYVGLDSYAVHYERRREHYGDGDGWQAYGYVVKDYYRLDGIYGEDSGGLNIPTPGSVVLKDTGTGYVFSMHFSAIQQDFDSFAHVEINTVTFSSQVLMADVSDVKLLESVWTVPAAPSDIYHSLPRLDDFNTIEFAFLGDAFNAPPTSYGEAKTAFQQGSSLFSGYPHEDQLFYLGLFGTPDTNKYLANVIDYSLVRPALSIAGRLIELSHYAGVFSKQLSETTFSIYQGSFKGWDFANTGYFISPTLSLVFLKNTVDVAAYNLAYDQGTAPHISEVCERFANVSLKFIQSTYKSTLNVGAIPNLLTEGQLSPGFDAVSFFNINPAGRSVDAPDWVEGAETLFLGTGTHFGPRGAWALNPRHSYGELSSPDNLAHIKLDMLVGNPSNKYTKYLAEDYTSVMNPIPCAKSSTGIVKTIGSSLTQVSTYNLGVTRTGDATNTSLVFRYKVSNQATGYPELTMPEHTGIRFSVSQKYVGALAPASKAQYVARVRQDFDITLPTGEAITDIAGVGTVYSLPRGNGDIGYDDLELVLSLAFQTTQKFPTASMNKRCILVELLNGTTVVSSVFVEVTVV